MMQNTVPQQQQQFPPQMQMPQGYPMMQQRPNMAMMYAQNPQQMQFQQQQNMLIDSMQNFNIGGAPRVNKQQATADRQAKRTQMNEFPSLKVYNLPKKNFFDLDFYKYFTHRGYKVKTAKVVLDTRTSISTGKGYLQFVLQEDADKCLNEMNNTVIQGETIRLVPSVAKAEFDPLANLLVRNIDKSKT